MSPLSIAVADLVALLDADLREAYEERAGIVEFDAGMPRDQAECLALLGLLAGHPGALLGVTALRIELRGAAGFVLTTDAEAARQKVTSAGGRVVGPGDVSEVVRETFRGAARLVPLDATF